MTASPVSAAPAVRRAVDFLRSIGIGCDYADTADGFLAGVRIRKGGLLVSPVANVGDVLHEAGHLACLPGRWRRLAEDDIDQVVARMMDIVDFSDPDRGEARAALQCGDSEATAWAWAVGEHLGLAPEDVVRDEDYQGTGADIRVALQARMYAGIHGLSSAGFCVVRPALEQLYGRPAYPKLSMWLQSDFDVT